MTKKQKSFLESYQSFTNQKNRGKPETVAKREQESSLKYTSNPKNQDKVTQYNSARKQMGLSSDENLTKKKYDSYFGNANTGDKGIYGRFQEYNSKQTQAKSTPKKSGLSFDQKVDKGLSKLSKTFNSVKKEASKLANTNGLTKGYTNGLKNTVKAISNVPTVKDKFDKLKLGLKAMDKVDQYTYSPLKNIAARNTKDLKETQKYIDEQKKDGKKVDLKSQSYKDALNVKQDFKDAYSGKRRSSMEESFKNAGISTGSKYGDKALAFTVDGVADPANLVGAGAYKQGAKAFKGLSKIAKVAEEVKAVEEAKSLLPKTPKTKVVNEPKIQPSIEKIAKKEPKALNIDQPPKKRPKGSKVSKRRPPNGVLMAEGLMEKPNTIKPIDQIKSEALAKGQLDPTTAPLTRVDEVKPGTPVEQVSKGFKDLQGIKDIKTFQTGTKNLYEVADKLPKLQRDRIVNDLDVAKVNNVNYQKAHTDDLFNKLVKGNKIKKGSKESALIQDYGEKTLAKKYLVEKGVDPESLPKEELDRINKALLQKLRPSDWEKFVKADEYFKAKYKEHLTNVNNTRSQIYPNQPDRLVPERQDYYHHFNEMEGLAGVMNQLTSPTNIDPKLVGISHQTKPKAKFQGFMQKRGLGPYKSDAIGGYLKYLQAASHSINVDPVISTLKGTAKEIAEATGETKNANNIIEALQDHAGDLAGKTNPFDRVLLKAGRKTVNIANTVNNRVKTNMILGNLGSALGQFGNIPLAVGKANIKNSTIGLADTLGQFGKFIAKGEKNAPIHQSNFIKERFLGKDYARFDQKLIEQPKKMAVWMLEAADQVGTSFTWNSMYRKGLADKVADPIKYADSETRKIIGGRGVGEMPLLQKSKTAQIFMPFTYEVGNQWRVLKDMVGEKDAAGIITFLVASYGLNKVMEEVRGSGVSFDPLDALIDGYRGKDGKVPQKLLAAVGSLSGEVVGNIPGGNLAVGMLGDKKIKGTNLTVNEIFQDRNPNRFGTGLTASKIIENPSFLFAPFGANQVKKSIEGSQAIMDKGVYKPNGEMMYPIEPKPGLSGLMKMLQLGTMGKYSSSEGKDYFKNDRRPLSAKQTNRVDDKKTPEERLKEYALILKERKERAEKRKQ